MRSIVDRFLEHSRIYYFENACQPQVFISSADWMPRNFFRRIELAIPHRGRRPARADYQRGAGDFAGGQRQGPLPAAGRVVSARGAAPGGKARRSQVEFMALAPARTRMRRASRLTARPGIRRSGWRRRRSQRRSESNDYESLHPAARHRRGPGHPRLCEGRRPAAHRQKASASWRQIAEAMEALELSFDLILSSPYLRARQTAEIVAEAFKARKRLELSDSLTPGGSTKKLVELLNRLQPSPESVLLVGHEPYLSGLISLLVSGDTSFGGGDEEGRFVQALDRVAETWPLRRAGVAAHAQADGADEPDAAAGDDRKETHHYPPAAPPCECRQCTSRERRFGFQAFGFPSAFGLRISAFPARFHLDRAAGRHRHHRPPGRLAPAGAGQIQGQSGGGDLLQQPLTTLAGVDSVCRGQRRSGW